MRRAKEYELSEEEQAILERWSKGRRTEARQTERAKIILLCAAGMKTIDVAEKLEISLQKVARWRERFIKMRIAGIRKDAPRGGRKSELTKEMAERIIKVTTTEKPKVRRIGLPEPWQSILGSPLILSERYGTHIT